VEGKAEGKAEIIEFMLTKGRPVETIADFTGITVDVINQIKDELEKKCACGNNQG